MQAERYTEHDLRDMYNQMLDDCCEPIKIFKMEYSVSKVLVDVDPVAYRCGLNDYIDSLVSDEIIFEWEDGEYYNKEEPIEFNA